MDKKAKRKEARKAAVAALGVTCKLLEKRTKRCKDLQVQLKHKTQDITSRLVSYSSHPHCRDHGEKAKIIVFFVKQWFRSFIAVKDEAMVLFKGCLTRRYFVDEHASNVHTRGEQGKWYKDSDQLTACSVDGWRYEYHACREAHGESDALDGYADRVDACRCVSLHSLCTCPSVSLCLSLPFSHTLTAQHPTPCAPL